MAIKGFSDGCEVLVVDCARRIRIPKAELIVDAQAKEAANIEGVDLAVAGTQ